MDRLYEQQLMMIPPPLVPSEPGWVSVFGTDYWNVDSGGFLGQQYSVNNAVSPNQLALSPTGTWAEDFRNTPLTKVRITIAGIDGEIGQVYFTDSFEGTAGEFIGNYAGEEILLNVGSGPNLWGLTMEASVGEPNSSWVVTNIEFLAPFGWVPAGAG